MQRSEQTTCRNLVRASGGRPHAAHESSPVDARAHVRFCPSLPVSPRPRRVLCCPSEHPKGANSAASPVPASRVASHASGPSISQRITATPIVDRAATPTSAREKRTLCTPPAESATALPHIQIPAESATACPPSYKCGKNGNHLAAHSDSGKNGTPHRHLREFRQNRQPHRGLQRNRQPRIMGAQSNVRIPAESATSAPKNRNSGRIGNSSRFLQPLRPFRDLRFLRAKISYSGRIGNRLSPRRARRGLPAAASRALTRRRNGARARPGVRSLFPAAIAPASVFVASVYHDISPQPAKAHGMPGSFGLPELT